MENVISDIRESLKECADSRTLASGQKFFREKILFHGVAIKTVTAIGKEYFENIGKMEKHAIFDLCELLWQSGYLEESFIACNWSYYIHNRYEPSDYKVFERWIDKYVTNWASCDTLCNHTVGTFIEMFPEYITGLKTMALSPNRWMRRAAAVTLIVPARKGSFLNDILEIADILLIDKDDMVRKGYGWMLKVSSQAHQQEIFNYIMKNKSVMPRTSLRYAIEKMPLHLRQRAMEK